MRIMVLTNCFYATLPISTLSTYTAPNRSNIVWYGKTFTDDTGTSSSTYYNSNFANFNSSGGDCQNFVSQAIWYGFGGQNNSTAINNHYSPMIDLNQSGTHDWWADKTTTDSDWMWTGVDYFKAYIIDNYNYDKYGVQGHVGSLDYLQPGDYLYQSGHVVLVTQANDTNGDGKVDFNGIYYSAHNNNRKDHRLADFYSPGDFTYMWIAYIKQ